MTKRDAERIIKAAKYLLQAEDSLCSIKNNGVYDAVMDDLEKIVIPQELNSAAQILMKFVETNFLGGETN